MKLSNKDLSYFIDKIKLQPENMGKYREQINNLKNKLEKKISEDDNHDLKVKKYLLAGSWKKRTILRPTGENPIDIDLILFVTGNKDIHNDMSALYDFIIEYLKSIYPQKDIKRDVDATGNTKSITINFIGTGLKVDIVPVVPLSDMEEYVWQPSREGGKKYITSISKQLSFSLKKRQTNPSYTSIVRALKWWKNHREINETDMDVGLSSFSIELIVAYLDEKEGIPENIEEGIIRFFRFVSDQSFPIIYFQDSIGKAPTSYKSSVYIADNTNKDNNIGKKLDNSVWDEIKEEAEEAFDTLNIAQSKNNKGDTIQEWKRVFGPTFNLN